MLSLNFNYNKAIKRTYRRLCIVKDAITKRNLKGIYDKMLNKRAIHKQILNNMH